jgi:tRNA(Ile)-lysidine synthase
MEYIKKKHLEFKSDRSNLNFKFRRNYLRHTVLPTIEKINPGFKKSVGRLTCILQADNDFIKNCSEYFYKRITKETDKNKISLDLKKFNRIHTSMQREIIKMIVRRILKSKYSPPFLVIEEVRKKITGNRLPINIRELSISLSLCNGIIIIQKNPAGL